MRFLDGHKLVDPFPPPAIGCADGVEALTDQQLVVLINDILDDGGSELVLEVLVEVVRLAVDWRLGGPELVVMFLGGEHDLLDALQVSLRFLVHLLQINLNYTQRYAPIPSSRPTFISWGGVYKSKLDLVTIIHTTFEVILLSVALSSSKKFYISWIT